MFRHSVPAFLLVACLAASGCGKKPVGPAAPGEPAKPAAQKPVKLVIGVLAPTTGPDAAKGQAVMAGLRLAIKQKGAAVGLDASSIEARDCGVAGSDELGLARTLVNVEGAGVLVGPLDEKGVESLDDLSRQKQVPLFTTAPGAMKLSLLDCAVRRLTFTDAEEGAAMAELAAKKGYRSAAAFVDTSSNASEARVAAFTERFLRFGGHVISQVAYSKGDAGFDHIVRMASPGKSDASAKPDVFYLSGSRAESAGIIEEMKKQNVLGAVLGSSDWTDGEFPADVSPGAGVYAPCRFFAGAGNPAALTFASAVSAESKREPSAYDAMGYDAGLAIIDALTRGGDFAESVGKVKLLPGVTGKLTARDGSFASQVTILRLKGKAFEFDSVVDIK